MSDLNNYRLTPCQDATNLVSKTQHKLGSVISYAKNEYHINLTLEIVIMPD